MVGHLVTEDDERVLADKPARAAVSLLESLSPQPPAKQPREALGSFEAWARNAVPQFSAAGKHVRDGAWSYNHNIVQLMWQCWQAAALPPETGDDAPPSLADEVRGIAEDFNYSNEAVGIAVRNWFHRLEALSRKGRE